MRTFENIRTRLLIERAAIIRKGPRTRETVMVRTRSGAEVPRPGDWKDGPETRRKIRIRAFPIGENRALPIEGVRINDQRTFYTAEPLLTGEETTNGKANSDYDILEYEGERYRIHRIRDWGPYFEAIGARMAT